LICNVCSEINLLVNVNSVLTRVDFPSKIQVDIYLGIEMHPNSLKNLELGRTKRSLKKKVLISVEPETLAWLKGVKGRGSVSECVEELVARAGQLRRS
jgi:hypothetical protein